MTSSYHMGKNVKAIRTKMGMTQTQIAEKLQLTKSAVSAYERRRILGGEIVYKLSDILGCSTDEIFYGAASKSSQLETDLKELSDVVAELKQELQAHKEEYKRDKAQDEDED